MDYIIKHIYHEINYLYYMDVYLLKFVIHVLLNMYDHMKYKVLDYNILDDSVHNRHVVVVN